MKPKPPGLGPQYGAQFKDASIVAAYGTRPRYPEALYELVLRLAGVSKPQLLDLGCGTGEIARRLAPSLDRITAVDHSEAMIAAARELPGGRAPNIEWRVGRVEDAPLVGPFSLALAAESFHWFDWEPLCSRLVDVVPSAMLVLVEHRRELPSAWSEALKDLIVRYSTNQDVQPFDLVEELVGRHCFVFEERTIFAAETIRQSVDNYVTSLHSRNGLSRDRLPELRAREFDEQLRTLISPYAVRGTLELRIETAVAWGRVRKTS